MLYVYIDYNNIVQNITNIIWKIKLQKNKKYKIM